MHTRTPSTNSRVFSKTETFFSEYGYRPYVTGIFGHFQIRSPGWRVLKAEIHRIRVDGRKHDDVMPSFTEARFSAHTIRKRYVWTQIFLNTEKNLRF